MEKLISTIQRIRLAVTEREQQRKQKIRLKKEFDQVLRSGRSVLPKERSEQLLQNLHVKIQSGAGEYTQKHTTTTMFPSVVWVRYAVAAMVLLVAGALWNYYGKENKTGITASSGIQKEKAVIVESNYSEGVRTLILSDQSVVRLSKGSSISYYASFDTGRRDISLSGKAVFEVAKDAARPFTVYAGDISTTVLGTRFMMSTAEKNKVHVKLYEGKVLIRSAAITLAMHDIYLNPGEQFVIDKNLLQFAVSSFKTGAANAGTASPGSGNANYQVLEFNQEPLTSVLAIIGKRYNVQFAFDDNNNFKSMLVTGKLLPSDSLQVVLSMLGNINGLAFKEHDHKIRVEKIP